MKGVSSLFSLKLSILDTSDPSRVEQYEKSFFKAFYGINDSAMDLISDTDKTNKVMRTKLPYKDQAIFIADLNGAIVSAVAINRNLEDRLQLEMLGFSIDKKEAGIVEGLIVFNLQTFFGMESIALKLKDFAQQKIDEWKIRKIYGTCSKRLLRGYQILGWKVIDEKTIGSTQEYLLVKMSE
jgi:hypothetical protein